MTELGCLERAYASEANAFPFALGDVDCSCAIRLAVSDGLDPIDERHGYLAGEYKVAGYVL